MTTLTHLSLAEMEQGLDEIRRSPQDEGTVSLIVRRPSIDARELLEEGELTAAEGLAGDNWRTRKPGPPPPADSQLTLMNVRVASLLAQDDDRRVLAGDQLFVDLDLSEGNVPAGTRLALGSAVIEITTTPHNGCKKFAERFGPDAMRFVNSPVGKEMHLRGIYARVVQEGTVRAGETIRKI